MDSQDIAFSIPDSAIVAKIQAGQGAKSLEETKEAWSDACTLIIRKYARLVHALCRSRLPPSLNNSDGVENLTQEVWIAIYNAMPTFEIRNQATTFQAFLCVIIKRRIVDAIRALTRQEKVQRDLPEKTRSESPGFRIFGGVRIPLPSLANTLEQQHGVREEFAALDRALDELSSEEQHLVRMRFVDDLPTQEIAERLGMRHDALRQKLARLLKKLRAIHAQKTERK